MSEIPSTLFKAARAFFAALQPPPLKVTEKASILASALTAGADCAMTTGVTAPKAHIIPNKNVAFIRCHSNASARWHKLSFQRILEQIAGNKFYRPDSLVGIALRTPWRILLQVLVWKRATGCSALE